MAHLNYPSYEHEIIHCTSCKWSGEGKLLKTGEYYAMSNIADLHCPDCHEKIGHVQFPVDNGKTYDKDEDRKYW